MFARLLVVKLYFSHSKKKKTKFLYCLKFTSPLFVARRQSPHHRQPSTFWFSPLSLQTWDTIKFTFLSYPRDCPMDSLLRRTVTKVTAEFGGTIPWVKMCSHCSLPERPPCSGDWVDGQTAVWGHRSPGLQLLVMSLERWYTPMRKKEMKKRTDC